VIDASGPLPLEGTYTSKGGTLLISASGSGYRDTTLDGLIAMKVMVDGTWYGTAEVFTNETNSHKAFVVDNVVVSGLPAGQHTVRLEEFDHSSCNNTTEERTYLPCTTTNHDDSFKVTVLEIPAS